MDDKPSARDSARTQDNEATAEKQRALQREQDRKEPAQGGSGGKDQVKGAPQTSARKYPDELPAQHLEKPGLEADMQLKPQFHAPDYRGSGKLKGMVALITGGDSGIGRAVAVLFAREGADVAIVYLSSHDDAQETRRCIEQEGRQCLLVAGDVKDSKFC